MCSEGDESRIPVIDLAVFLEGGKDDRERSHALRQVRQACEEWGFFQVVNHGVDPGLLENARKCSEAFFQLPLDDKLKLVTERSPYGFVNKSGASGVIDRREHLLFYGPRHPGNGLNVWPEKPDFYRAVIEELMQQAEKACMLLTRVIFESAGLSRDYAGTLFKSVMDTFIMPYYPAAPPDFRQEMVLGAHRDAGIVTLLGELNHVLGLQILKDDKWITVQTVKGALIVNVGDMMQVWTNGRYKSVKHRVAKNEVEDRYSCAFFSIPGMETEVSPLAEFVSDETPPKYRDFTLGEYMRKRLENRNLGGAAEVSIEHYAI